MPDLLLELRSEEIPARMQRKAAGDLKKLVTNALVEAGLTYEAAREYWTPRRLTLDIRGLTPRSADLKEEIKGPSTKAPEQAVQGFLRKAGLDDIAQAHVHTDPKKGDFYVAHLSKPGRAAEEIVTDVMPAIIRGLPWPKSMRWGKASARPGSLRWVRPLQSIVCTFGPETEEPVVIPFEIDGIVAGNITYGHRFHAPDAIKVRRFDDYVTKLEHAFVVLDGERRKQIIAADAQNLAFAAGLELVEDEGLLEEVSGLVEWPVTLTGEFEEAYLQIPDEVIRLTIKTNQKCFVLRKPDGQLSNKFVLVANIEASDGGVEIAHGNAKVVRARLSDALYFWTTDQKDLPDIGQLTASAEKFGLDLAKPLDQRMARLDHLGVTFHAKLGTQGERVSRIAKLAAELAPVVAASLSSTSPLRGGRSAAPGGGEAASGLAPENTPNPSPQGGGEQADIVALATRAAVLAKADLTTEIVGEFPELQGAMGRTYATLQGEHPSVALALEEHYKPQGPSDSVPTDPVAIAVALADKLDTLVGFWAIDEKPTGSRDPYALRRAALGVIRIVVENGTRIELQKEILPCLIAQKFGPTNMTVGGRISFWRGILTETDLLGPNFFRWLDEHTHVPVPRSENALWRQLVETSNDLLSFFHDRLKVYLKDQGARHDLIDAVITPDADDLLQIVRRVEALGAFLDSEDGSNLLAGAKRAANILAAEEKKGTSIAPVVSEALFEGEAEKTLFKYVNQVSKNAAEAIEKQDYSAAMSELATLREPVDSFFEDVLVNADDTAVRANRLALVGLIRTATATVADFSRISG